MSTTPVADAAFVESLRTMAGTPNISAGNPTTIITRARKRTAQRRGLASAALGVVLFTGAGVAAIAPGTTTTPIMAVSEVAPEVAITPLTGEVLRVAPTEELLAPLGAVETDAMVETEAYVETAEEYPVEVAPESQTLPTRRFSTTWIAVFGLLGVAAMAVAGWFAMRARYLATN
ncbi:MAG: hypothetical protein FWG25_07410 [Promicromonosporaceae bacterium]|nr:hypothetical protein [Promicromonosporaceae bacterium]